MSRNRCTFPGCYLPVKSRGLCDGHRTQRRKGRPLTPLREWPNRKNVVMGRALDPACLRRLEAAALRYANAETDAEYDRARRFLVASAITVAWRFQSRRAPSVGALTPAQPPSPVLGEGAATTEEAA